VHLAVKLTAQWSMLNAQAHLQGGDCQLMLGFTEQQAATAAVAAASAAALLPAIAAAAAAAVLSRSFLRSSSFSLSIL
jgi:hypothetical protein